MKPQKKCNFGIDGATTPCDSRTGSRCSTLEIRAVVIRDCCSSECAWIAGDIGSSSIK